MKKLVWLLLAVLTLTGCGGGTEPVFETMADPDPVPVVHDPAPVAVWLPAEAAAQTGAGEVQCYTWDNCELRIETLTGGDIRSTLAKLTGMDPQRLTVMEYERDGLQLYQTVWSATGEEGVTLGRCMVADDGAWHYCISLLSPETADVAEDFAQICASLDLSGEEQLK